MNHTFKRYGIGKTGEPAKHAARCERCGAYSGQLDHEWEVNDFEAKHLADIEVVKAYLRTSTPSLKSQRDYYRVMSEDHTVSESDRVLWKQLADELDKRVNDGAQKTEQGTLL